MEPGLSAIAAFALAVSLAVLTALLALAARPGERGWGSGLAGRLERLGSPAWVGREAKTRKSGASEPSSGRGSRRLPGRLVRGLAVGGAGATAGLVFSGKVVPAAAVAVGAFWVWEARLAAARAAERHRLHEGLEGALEAMVASLKAGKSLARAIEDAAGQVGEPACSILAKVGALHRAGTPLPEALDHLRAAAPGPETAYLAACLCTHLRTGGDVTALLINLGGVIREREHLVRDLAGRTSEARATATLLAFLPPGLGLYILWVEPAQLAILLADSFGLVATVVAGACWVAGVLVIQRMLAGLARDIGEEG